MINSFLKILSSRFSLVLSAAALISALAIVGLLPMAVESIIHDIKGIASKQQFFTEDLTDTGQHFTDLELLIKQVDELGQVATIEISGERSCVSPCGSFTDKITFFGINDQTKDRRTHSKNVSITIPDENTFVSGEIKLPFNGRLFRYPFDSYTLGIGVTIERTFKDQPPRLLTPDEIANSFELSFSESISRMELKSFKKVDGAQYKPRNVHAPYIIAGIAEFERPMHLKIIVTMVVLMIVLVSIYTMATRPFNELIFYIGVIILVIFGARELVIKDFPSDTTIVDTVFGIVVLYNLIVVILRSIPHFYYLSKTIPEEGKKKDE
jgi:hypothetical protein